MSAERSVSEQLQQHLRRHARTGVRWVYPGSAPLPPAAVTADVTAPEAASESIPSVPHARLMFIGEPADSAGSPEDKASQLLTKIIEAIGLAREDVHIASVADMALSRLIETVAPAVLVSLGNAVTRTLLGDDYERSQWSDFEGVPLMPTLHPNDLLENASAKRALWEDMKRVVERYNEGLPAGMKKAGAKSR